MHYLHPYIYHGLQDNFLFPNNSNGAEPLIQMDQGHLTQAMDLQDLQDLQMMDLIFQEDQAMDLPMLTIDDHKALSPFPIILIFQISTIVLIRLLK